MSQWVIDSLGLISLKLPSPLWFLFPSPLSISLSLPHFISYAHYLPKWAKATFPCRLLGEGSRLRLLTGRRMLISLSGLWSNVRTKLGSLSWGSSVGHPEKWWVYLFGMCLHGLEEVFFLSDTAHLTSSNIPQYNLRMSCSDQKCVHSHLQTVRSKEQKW